MNELKAKDKEMTKQRLEYMQNRNLSEYELIAIQEQKLR